MKISSRFITAGCFLCANLSVNIALADIRITESVTIEAAGRLSIFAAKSKVVTQISGKKSRTDSSVEMESKTAAVLALDGESSSIMYLDEARSLYLEPRKKRYYEMSFAETRAQAQRSRDAMLQADVGASALPVSADNCEWTDGDVQVEHPSGKKKIAGISTRKHSISKRQYCFDQATGNTCEMAMILESWNASRAPNQKEVLQFREDYAAAMALDGLEERLQGPAGGVLAMFGDNWIEIEQELAELKGYPLRMVLQMKIGGADCTTESGQPIAEDSLWADASTSAYNAAVAQTGAEAGSAVGTAAGDAMGDSVGGSIGGAAVGAVTGEIIGGLAGMFKKKKPSKTKQKPVRQPVGEVTVFRVTAEVTDWNEQRLPAGTFSVPPNWKKIEAP